MGKPLGARKNGKFKAVSTAPSFNKTPMGSSTPPVPYPVYHDLSNSAGTIKNVYFNGDPVYVLNQTTQTKCTGDTPGSAKGIKSGTVNGEIKPTSASSSVNVGKRPLVRQGDKCTLNSGNCPGVYVTEPAVAPAAPPKKKKKFSLDIHDALDVLGFIPGLGAIPDLANAGIYALKGNYAMAGLSVVAAVPGYGDAVKGGAMIAKGGKKLIATEAKQLEKQVVKNAGKKTATDTVEKTAKKKGSARVKKKNKLKCGDLDQYGVQKQKTGNGKYDRDHVPSKAALKEKARELAEKRGDLVSKAQLDAIENLADSIAIPKGAHQKDSRTFGKRNNKAKIKKDAADLRQAANNDLDALIDKIEKHDKRCAKAYKKAAKKLRDKIAKNDNHYEDFINIILDNF